MSKGQAQRQTIVHRVSEKPNERGMGDASSDKKSDQEPLERKLIPSKRA